MKYRCIRLDYRDGNGELSYLPMEVGRLYEIVFSYADRVSIGGYIFSIEENKSGLYLRNFEDYFVSVEEYRDYILNGLI